MILYQNYHRHTQQTNPLVPDSTASNEQYAIRAHELGHGIISSCEHGYQGRYIECYNLAKQYGLKFVQVAEAYWVKERNPNLADKSNCHIIIAALNEAGRRDMNRILSEANRSGFYIRPRVDMELLTSLNPSNVIITTACIGYWKYDDTESLMLKMHQHFGNHFYLEVQCHNTESQRHLNSRIKKLHYKYKIPLIFGCDSHYIHPEDAKERDDFLYSKDMHYEDEEGWYLDYVDGDTIYDRFVKQGVLSHDEIMEAMNNTNIFLQVEEYDCSIFNQEIKLPSLYPDWTQEQKDAEYTRLIWERWDEYSKQIPVHKHPLYQKEIQREIDIVVESHMADYFILNYYIIKRGKELGGVITSSGRGSAVSFITNRLLGFTEVDRISAHVEMYPERFMSATRILETGSLPDELLSHYAVMYSVKTLNNREHPESLYYQTLSKEKCGVANHNGMVTRYKIGKSCDTALLNGKVATQCQGATAIISTLMVHSIPLLKYRETEGIKDRLQFGYNRTICASTKGSLGRCSRISYDRFRNNENLWRMEDVC